MSGKRNIIQNVLFLHNVSQGFVVHLFRFVRKHLPPLRFCFLEMRHCETGWLKIVVGRAGAPQTCTGLFTVVSLWLSLCLAVQQFHSSMHRHTRDHHARVRGYWVSLPSSFRHLLWRSFQNSEAQEWFWDLPKTTGGLLPFFRVRILWIRLNWRNISV